MVLPLTDAARALALVLDGSSQYYAAKVSGNPSGKSVLMNGMIVFFRQVSSVVETLLLLCYDAGSIIVWGRPYGNPHG
ncbi:hypothetical protein BDFB_009893, partial [Asbolus verrucosus]